MKKILFTILLIILLTACTKKEEVPKVKKVKEKEKPQVVETYKDTNNTPISFYELKGNTLTKVNSITNNYNPLDDITLIQIYPSSEDTINLSKDFASEFYDTWTTLNPNNNIKIGFSLKYKVNNEEVIYPILSPSNTMDHWEYFMTYLYDDYINKGKGFYSHLENDEFNDNTLFTSIKVQCGSNCKDIKDTVEFSVFTYDSSDDFINNEYRGNSKYSIPICLNGTC